MVPFRIDKIANFRLPSKEVHSLKEKQDWIDQQQKLH